MNTRKQEFVSHEMPQLISIVSRRLPCSFVRCGTCVRACMLDVYAVCLQGGVFKMKRHICGRAVGSGVDNFAGE